MRLQQTKFEVYMKVKDRQTLAALIEAADRRAQALGTPRVSKRAVARAAGWKSHTYLLRLLNGSVRTLEEKPAVHIAAFLGVPVETLFLPEIATSSGGGDQRSKVAQVRKAKAA